VFDGLLNETAALTARRHRVDGADGAFRQYDIDSLTQELTTPNIHIISTSHVDRDHGAPPRYTRCMDDLGKIYEKFKVHGKDLADQIRKLIHEGNVRRIIVRDEHGHTFMEIPLTVATIGVIAAPVLAAVGAIATLVAKFEIVVERSAPPASEQPGAKPDSEGEKP